ncbi:MAG: response regulator [Syntrophorhabdales bacterium]|jgi:two-component system chemotaxis response regulator CheY
MRKVLVVDDSICTRKLLSLMLKCSDYVTFEAEDGLDALEKLSTLKVDLVIVERDLPNMDGLTFVRSVRKNFYVLDMPVVMVSDFVDEDLKDDALRAGIDHLFVKPVSSALLVSGIESLLRERGDGRSTDRQG